MFSLVTMEKIRIEGFHGDYLKISFFEGPGIAAGSLDAPGTIRGFLGVFSVAVPSDLPPGLEKARTLSGVTLRLSFSWGPVCLASVSSAAHSDGPGSFLLLLKQNRTPLCCGCF